MRRREPIFGPNAKPFFFQFALGLGFLWFFGWITDPWLYELTTALSKWLIG